MGMGLTKSRAPDEIDPKLVKATKLMDESITVPGLNYKVGLDGIIGLIPGVGDLTTTFMAAWTLKEAKRLGLSKWGRFRIAGYYGIDFFVGLIPFAGDLFDFAFKANRKSLALIQKHLDKQKRKQTASRSREAA